MKRQAVKMPRHTLQKGFTLIEALIAILLVGVAVAALVGASRSFTMANDVGVDLSTAEFLIEQVRERSVSVNYDNLYGLKHFNNVPFSPPISADGNSLNDFAAFSEQITVKNVNPSDFTKDVPTSDFVRVTVKVLLNSRQISSISWIRARY